MRSFLLRLAALALVLASVRAGLGNGVITPGMELAPGLADRLSARLDPYDGAPDEVRPFLMPNTGGVPEDETIKYPREVEIFKPVDPNDDTILFSSEKSLADIVGSSRIFDAAGALDSSLSLRTIGISLPVFPIFPWWGMVFNSVNASWSPWQKLCVKVNQAPVDVLFLADTTGSMGSYITAVKSAASSMFTSMSTTLTNLKIGVSAYKDSTDAYQYKNFQPIATLTAASFTAAINNWVAGGGGDWPEAQLFALQQLSTSALTGWRAGSIKIVVWFGDAPGHDPAYGGVTFAAAQAALLAKGIKVIALDCASLNFPMPGPQASTLASATGGFYGTVAASTIASTMISTIANVAVNVKAVITCPTNTPIIVEVDPPTTVATPLKPGCFRVRVKACNATDCSKPGHYTCSIQMVDVGTGSVISTYPIFINTMPGSDTTAPTFSPSIPPVSLLMECPAYYKCPSLTAVDNCDGNWTVNPIVSAVTGNTCKWSQSCTWATQDASHNAVSVMQSVTVVDTTPPVQLTQCALGALCITQTSPNPFCFSKSKLVSQCFRDRCNKIEKFSVTCAGCADSATGTPTTFWPFTGCKDASDGTDQICMGWNPALPASFNSPICCRLLITVTDTCGNTAMYPIKVCYVPRGVTNPYQCISV